MSGGSRGRGEEEAKREKTGRKDREEENWIMTGWTCRSGRSTLTGKGRHAYVEFQSGIQPWTDIDRGARFL